MIDRPPTLMPTRPAMDMNSDPSRRTGITIPNVPNSPFDAGALNRLPYFPPAFGQGQTPSGFPSFQGTETFQRADAANQMQQQTVNTQGVAARMAAMGQIPMAAMERVVGQMMTLFFGRKSKLTGLRNDEDSEVREKNEADGESGIFGEARLAESGEAQNGADQ